MNMCSYMYLVRSTFSLRVNWRLLMLTDFDIRRVGDFDDVLLIFTDLFLIEWSLSYDHPNLRLVAYGYFRVLARHSIIRIMLSLIYNLIKSSHFTKFSHFYHPPIMAVLFGKIAATSSSSILVNLIASLNLSGTSAEANSLSLEKPFQVKSVGRHRPFNYFQPIHT